MTAEYDAVVGTLLIRYREQVMEKAPIRSMLSHNETEEQVILENSWWVFGTGCLILLIGIAVISALVWAITIAVFRGEELGVILGFTFVIALIGLPAIWFGTLFVGWTTKVSFNHELGCISATRGHISPLLQFLRTKRISREEVQTAHFSASEALRGQGGSATKYEVKVDLKSGKGLVVHRAYWKGEQAKYLAGRILEFSHQQVK